MEVADNYDWTMIAAFTSIYDRSEYDRPRDRDFGAALRERVARFWADVDAGHEPKPDFGRDLDTIKALHVGGPEPLDRTTDEHFNALLAKYSRLKDEKSA